MRKTRLPVSLNDHRERFEHEDAAHEHEQKLLLDEKRDRSDGASER